MRLRTLPTVMMLAALTLSGCRDPTGVGGATSAAAGIYVLQPPGENVAYGTPESGTMRLTRSGNATRDVQYRAGTGMRSYVLKGTFRVEGQTVALRLIEQTDGATYEWTPAATLDGSTLTLRYPGPADGEIIETYHRLSSIVP